MRREYRMIYRGPGFLATVIWLARPPPPALPPPREQVVSLSQPSSLLPCRACWHYRGEWAGEEPNHTTARRPGPLKITQYFLVVRMLVTCTRTLQIKQKEGFALVQVCRISAVSSCKCANPGRYANVRVCFQIHSILDTVRDTIVI